MRLIDSDRLERQLDDMIHDYEDLLSSGSADDFDYGYMKLTMFIKSLVKAQPTIDEGW